MSSESRDIVLFHQGHVKTFEDIYHQYYPSVMFFARKMTRSATIAEEIAMDSFRKLWMRRKDFEDKSSIKAWLFITTKNACLTYLHTEKRRSEVNQELKIREEQRQEEATNNYEFLAENVAKLLHEEINKLPTQCKIILKLRLEGYSNREIGKLMNISIFTVRNQVATSFKKLKITLLDIEHLVLVTLILRAFL